MSERYDDFDRLVLRHKGYIRRLCWWYVGGDEVACTDLVQDVLVQLWQYRDKLRAGSSELQERLWVKFHCRSVCSHRRRSKRPTAVSLDGIDVAQPVDNAREVLLDMTDELNERERDVLQMLLDGYRQAEIAERMGLEVNNVSQIRYRMIEKMRKTYNNKNNI